MKIQIPMGPTGNSEEFHFAMGCFVTNLNYFQEGVVEAFFIHLLPNQNEVADFLNWLKVIKQRLPSLVWHVRRMTQVTETDREMVEIIFAHKESGVIEQVKERDRWELDIAVGAIPQNTPKPQLPWETEFEDPLHEEIEFTDEQTQEQDDDHEEPPELGEGETHYE